MAIKDSVFNSLSQPQAVKSNKSRFARFYTPHDLSVPPSPSEEIEKKSEIISPNNGTQTVHKRTTNGTHNGAQTAHKRGTNIAIGTQTVHKRYPKPNTNGTQINALTVHERYTNHGVSGLIGNQKILLNFIYEICKSSANHVTETLTFDSISEITNINKNSIKTTIQRLKSKGIISLYERKDGRGGWVKFELNSEAYKDLMLKETVHKRGTNEAQTVHKRYPKPNTNPSSSSSYININTTTTSEGENLQKPVFDESWQAIDLEPLAGIGFTQSHLKQLCTGTLTPDVIQESIHAFAFDLEFNNRAKDIRTDPVNYFMGRLRKGLPYTPPTNYEPIEIREMRLFVERKKEIELKRKTLEKEILNIEFEQWFEKLTNEEKNNLCPREGEGNLALRSQKGRILNYFETVIWEKKKAKKL